jgi:uncharacterized protein YutE (UPF0331/DUF86 family)
MREEIIAKLEDLKKYVNFLRQHGQVNLKKIEKDELLRSACERNLQISIEICIEIGEMIISNGGYRKPQSYRDVFGILASEGVLEEKFAKKFEGAAGVRNILVHHYAEVDIEKLHIYITQNLTDFDEYAKQVSRHLMD